MAAAADLRRRLFPDCRHALATWCARPSTARRTVDEERRTRAAILLRVRVGGLCCAARPGGFVDRAAALAHARCAEARGLRCPPGVDGQSCAPRAAPPYPADRAG